MPGSRAAAARIRSDGRRLVRSTSPPAHRRTTSPSIATWSATQGSMFSWHQASNGSATTAGSVPASRSASSWRTCRNVVATPRPKIGVVVATASPTLTRPGTQGPCVPGLVSVGDAVATTTPIFGRGVATTFLQVLQLLALLDAGTDPAVVAEPFDAWCQENMLPWVADHVAMDGDVVRRWAGGDVDLTRRLPSDLILAAAARDPGIAPATGGYLSMLQTPSSLDP